jgi:hypothetical protein
MRLEFFTKYCIQATQPSFLDNFILYLLYVMILELYIRNVNAVESWKIIVKVVSKSFTGMSTKESFSW